MKARKRQLKSDEPRRDSARGIIYYGCKENPNKPFTVQDFYKALRIGKYHCNDTLVATVRKIQKDYPKHKDNLVVEGYGERAQVKWQETEPAVQDQPLPLENQPEIDPTIEGLAMAIANYCYNNEQGGQFMERLQYHLETMLEKYQK